METRYMPTVLCFNCTHPGGLAVYLFGGVPIMSCSRCRWWVSGFYENGYAVFPDAHSHPDKLDDPVPAI